MSAPDSATIAHAARLLEAGELVAFPTETVYGLGADAANPDAVAKIYTAKGRPANHPVIVHLAPEADIAEWACDIPVQAHALMQAFWPGPLTLILKRAAHVPDAVSGGQDTIGLRCPAHPVAQTLLRAFKGGRGGIAAPSANRFGHVSPTTAEHVRDEFGSGPDSPVACILDGGPSEVGIESTIVDLSRMQSHGPVLLRPGQVSSAQLQQVLGMPIHEPDAHAPRASGTLDAHYAPATPVALVPASQLQDVLQRLHAAGRRVALVTTALPRSPYPVLQIDLPADVAGYAHGLYAALREADEGRAELIVVEAPPADLPWQGVNDRLRRAAHDSQGVLARLLGQP